MNQKLKEMIVLFLGIFFIFFGGYMFGKYHKKDITEKFIPLYRVNAYALYLDAIGIDWINGTYRIYQSKTLAEENMKFETRRMGAYKTPYKIKRVRIYIE